MCARCDEEVINRALAKWKKELQIKYLKDSKHCHKSEFALAVEGAREDRMSGARHCCGTSREKDGSAVTLSREDPWGLCENANVKASCYHCNVMASNFEMPWVKSCWKALDKHQLSLDV